MKRIMGDAGAAAAAVVMLGRHDDEKLGLGLGTAPTTATLMVRDSGWMGA
jgi:hypothetical protein